MSSSPSRALTPVSRTSSTEDLIPEASTPPLLHRAGAVRREKTPSSRISSAASMTAPATTTHLARAEEATTSRAEAAHSASLPTPKRLEKIARRIEKSEDLEGCAKKILLIAKGSDEAKYAGGSDYVKLMLIENIFDKNVLEVAGDGSAWTKLSDKEIEGILQTADTRFQENSQLLDSIQSHGGIDPLLLAQITQYKTEKGSINANQIIQELKTERTLQTGSFEDLYANALKKQIEDAQLRRAASHDSESTM